MPEYLAPGVYIEEIATGAVPIAGVGTSTAGFVGRAERGPSEPRLVTSWIDFRRWYGGLVDPDVLGSYLPFAIKGFFDNGGQRAYVTRITGTGATPSRATIGALILEALGAGDLDRRLFARIAEPSRRAPGDPTQPDPDRFKLSLLYYRTAPPPGALVDPLDDDEVSNPNRREPDAVEVFDDLEWQPGLADSVERRLLSSTLVSASWANDTPTRPPQADAWTEAASGADPTGTTAAHYVGRGPQPGDPGEGLEGLGGIDPIAILCVPDEVHPALDAQTQTGLRNAVVQQCQLLRDRFAILQLVQDAGGADPSSIDPPAVSEYAAVYHPWLRVLDPGANDTYLVPPGGHVAGIYARTDIERGVHKAPANAVVRGIMTQNLPGSRFPVSAIITRRQQAILNPKSINIIRDFRADNRGIRVWGARTLADNAQWRYVNVRRLFIFAEESIDEGTQWVVFEPNSEATWARVRRSVSNFLDSVWRSGALMGSTAEEAFFVRCDRTTMTQDDIDNGRLICFIGMAPVKPAEFVIFRFSQKTIEASA